jgi:HK97 gp10 family phage protein
MATKIEFTVQNVDKIINQYKNKVLAIDRVSDMLLETEGKRVLEVAKRNCPTDTGTLKDNLRVRKINNKDYKAVVVDTNEKDAFYVKFVEFGTVKQKANPFLGRTYAETKDSVQANIENGIRIIAERGGTP